MAITIKDIKIKNLSISKDLETGEVKVTGDYELISSNDVVLAKQGFNGYNEIKLDMSIETKQAINTFLIGIKKDLNTVLGLI